MNLSREIYEAVRNVYSWDGALLEELARNCVGLKDDSPHPGQRILLREVEEGLQRMVLKYFNGYLSGLDEAASPEQVASTLIVGDQVLVNLYGVHENALVDIAVVDPKDYSTSTPPTWALLSCAYKAVIAGLDKAVLILFDRNTQAWSVFKLRGAFTQSIQQFAKYVDDYGAQGPKASPTRIHEVKGVFSHPSTTLEADLNAHLWTLNHRPNNRRTGVIHPSEFSLRRCDRSVAYGLLGVDEKSRIPARLRRIFDVGHVLHDVIQKALEGHIDSFESEVRAESEDLKIAGSCDGVFRKLDDGLEIKSISDKGFSKLSKPKPEHERQAILYGSLIGLKGIYYVYVNKRTCELAVFYLEIDRKKWHKEAARAADLNKVVDAGDLPEKLTTDSTCRECKFVWTCRPELLGGSLEAFLR